ncbi:MAG TPA: TIM barrel protein, partial [Pirellulaceae bacterium]
MRIAVNQISTFHWTFEEDLRHYREAGLTALGVWRKKLDDCGTERGLDLLHESGLRVSSLSWAGGFTGSDGRSHRESIEDGLDAIRAAAGMKAGCLILYTGGRGGHTHSHAQRLVRVALQELVDAAAACDVCLALEPMHHDLATEWTFLTSLGATVDFLDVLREEGLDDQPAPIGLVVDAYHVLPEVAWSGIRAEWIPRVALIQIGDRRLPPGVDSDRVPLGTGSLPLADFV